MSDRSNSPPSKRVKLESGPSAAVIVNPDPELSNGHHEHEDGSVLQCSICLQETVDRTVIPTCSHEFCFDCIYLWSEQSRRCPLCSQSLGAYLIHDIRSKYDFRKRFLPPLRSTSPPPPALTRLREDAAHRRRSARERERDRRLREEREEMDRLERSISRRRFIYRHGLYAKHVASNAYTRYRPFPGPAQFAASTEYISRTTIFLRRELQVWDDLDVEFLTAFVISLMKSIDIRSDAAIRLLAEFLDMGASPIDDGRRANAEHFAHEIYCYLRSPFRDLFVYDSVVQYDEPPQPQRGAQGERSHCAREVSEPHSPNSISPSRPRSLSSDSLSPDNSVSPYPAARDRTGPADRPLADPTTVDPDGNRENGDQVAPLFSNEREISENNENSDSAVIPRSGTKAKLHARPDNRRAERPTFSSALEDDRPLDVDPLGRLALEAPLRQDGGREKKAPRNRSLIQSVQAHLSVGGPSMIVSDRPFRPRLGHELHRVPNPSDGENPPAPALLARLSGCSTVGIIPGADLDSSLPVLGPVTANRISSQHRPEKKGRLSVVRPEIDQTREESLGHYHHPPHSSATSLQSTTTTTTTTTTTRDTTSEKRIALLARLEREKNKTHAANNTNTDPDRVESLACAHATATAAAAGSESDGHGARREAPPLLGVVVVDPAVVEARLRTRARVRVRLAAEKTS